MHFVPLCITAIKDEDDREFMQTLYASSMKAMYRSAYEITHNYADAEDAVGAACESLIRSIDRFRKVHPKAYATYAITTVQNEALMILRKRKSEQRTREHLAASSVQQSDRMSDVDSQLFYNYALKEVIEAIRQLPEDDQLILRMKFFDQLSYTEIADILGVQNSTARTKLSRARRRLHEALKENQDDE